MPPLSTELTLGCRIHGSVLVVRPERYSYLVRAYARPGLSRSRQSLVDALSRWRDAPDDDRAPPKLRRAPHCNAAARLAPR